LAVVAVAMLGVGWLVLATIQGRIPRTIAVGVVDLLLVAVLSVPALVLVRVGLVYAMDRRIDAGDYDGTIRLADRFQSWWPRWAGSYMQKSSALIYAGRFAEAEAVLVEASGKNLKDQAAKTLMRSFLGSVFLEQGRYQEARAAFRGSTIERGDSQGGFPKEGRTLSADLGLAEVEIRSGGNLDAALDYAMESIRTGGQLYRKLEPDGYARALAIRAWAAGRLNRWATPASLSSRPRVPCAASRSQWARPHILPGADGDGPWSTRRGTGPLRAGRRLRSPWVLGNALFRGSSGKTSRLGGYRAIDGRVAA
jgi:hypothetical protein